VLNNGAITDVKVTDFGSVLNLDSDVTQVYRVGSLAYMSPEQLDGGTLDCRATCIRWAPCCTTSSPGGRPSMRRSSRR
jgi:serine/threonine protein kinase